MSPPLPVCLSACSCNGRQRKCHLGPLLQQAATAHSGSPMSCKHWGWRRRHRSTRCARRTPLRSSTAPPPSLAETTAPRAQCSTWTNHTNAATSMPFFEPTQLATARRLSLLLHDTRESPSVPHNSLVATTTSLVLPSRYCLRRHGSCSNLHSHLTVCTHTLPTCLSCSHW